MLRPLLPQPTRLPSHDALGSSERRGLPCFFQHPNTPSTKHIHRNSPAQPHTTQTSGFVALTFAHRNHRASSHSSSSLGRHHLCCYPPELSSTRVAERETARSHASVDLFTAADLHRGSASERGARRAREGLDDRERGSTIERGARRSREGLDDQERGSAIERGARRSREGLGERERGSASERGLRFLGYDRSGAQCCPPPSSCFTTQASELAPHHSVRPASAAVAKNASRVNDGCSQAGGVYP